MIKEFNKKVRELLKYRNNAHYIDLIIRVNGEDKRIEFDVLKDYMKFIDKYDIGLETKMPTDKHPVHESR